MNSVSGYERKAVESIEIRYPYGNELKTRPTGSDVPALTWDASCYVVLLLQNQLLSSDGLATVDRTVMIRERREEK
jgi:hypothetical protein